MKLDEAFDRFRSAVEIDRAARDYISKQVTLAREALHQLWPGCEVFLSGSYGRSTKIAPIRDVDLFVVYPVSYPEIARIRISRKDLFSGVESCLRRTFPEATFREQPRSVGLTFWHPPVRAMGIPAFAEDRFHLDVVPAVSRNRSGYYISSREQPGWLYTDPRGHQKCAVDVDRACGQMAVPLVKMLKIWNRDQRVGLKSFHLEVLVLRHLRGKPSSYADGARALFEQFGKSVEKSRCADPTNSTLVDEYLGDPGSGPRVVIAAEARRAAERMAEAIEARARGDHSTAIIRATQVFGPLFPSAGS